MDLLLRPATEILAALGRRQVSAVELLDATFGRIDALNPNINAVVAEDREAARRAAAESDRRRAQGRDGLLEGLPVTVKDAFDVAGLVSACGARQLAGRVPDRDAPAVARLRAAGAVIVGKSNVPAWCLDYQTANPVYGRTANPYDPARSPGGSSGGAAAALAIGMAAAELGSDLGGSIRWPAHATGLFALKPTFGLVSTRGHVPPAPGMEASNDLIVAGPMARGARDLDVLLSVIAGPPALDGVRPRLDPPRSAGPRGLRVAVWPGEPLAPVSAEVAVALDRAAGLLRDAGALVEEARPDVTFAELFEVGSLLNHAVVTAGLPAASRERIAAGAAGFAPGDLSHRALQARGAALDAPGLAALARRREALKLAFAEFFEHWDVVLLPPAPVVAVPHQEVADVHARTIDVDGAARPWLDILNWAIPASACQLPAAIAPVLRTAQGLPAGVQILAAEGADRTAIAVAGMLEREGCRFVPPPGI